MVQQHSDLRNEPGNRTALKHRIQQAQQKERKFSKSK